MSRRRREAGLSAVQACSDCFQYVLRSICPASDSEDDSEEESRGLIDKEESQKPQLFYVDNSQLQDHRHGLAFRQTPDYDDKAPLNGGVTDARVTDANGDVKDPPKYFDYVIWDTAVRGTKEMHVHKQGTKLTEEMKNDFWLKVGDRYLPGQIYKPEKKPELPPGQTPDPKAQVPTRRAEVLVPHGKVWDPFTRCERSLALVMLVGGFAWLSITYLVGYQLLFPVASPPLLPLALALERAGEPLLANRVRSLAIQNVTWHTSLLTRCLGRGDSLCLDSLCGGLRGADGATGPRSWLVSSTTGQLWSSAQDFPTTCQDILLFDEVTSGSSRACAEWCRGVFGERYFWELFSPACSTLGPSVVTLANSACSRSRVGAGASCLGGWWMTWLVASLYTATAAGSWWHRQRDGDGDGDQQAAAKPEPKSDAESSGDESPVAKGKSRTGGGGKTSGKSKAANAAGGAQAKAKAKAAKAAKAAKHERLRGSLKSSCSDGLGRLAWPLCCLRSCSDRRRAEWQTRLRWLTFLDFFGDVGTAVTFLGAAQLLCLVLYLLAWFQVTDPFQTRIFDALHISSQRGFPGKRWLRLCAEQGYRRAVVMTFVVAFSLATTSPYALGPTVLLFRCRTLIGGLAALVRGSESKMLLDIAGSAEACGDKALLSDSDEEGGHAAAAPLAGAAGDGEPEEDDSLVGHVRSSPVTGPIHRHICFVAGAVQPRGRNGRVKQIPDVLHNYEVQEKQRGDIPACCKFGTCIRTLGLAGTAGLCVQTGQLPREAALLLALATLLPDALEHRWGDNLFSIVQWACMAFLCTLGLAGLVAAAEHDLLVILTRSSDHYERQASGLPSASAGGVVGFASVLQIALQLVGLVICSVSISYWHPHRTENQTRKFLHLAPLPWSTFWKEVWEGFKYVPPPPLLEKDQTV